MKPFIVVLLLCIGNVCLTQSDNHKVQQSVEVEVRATELFVSYFGAG